TTNRWIHEPDTLWGDTPCRWPSLSSPRHQHRFDPFFGGGQFILLNRPRWIDVFRANLRALANKLTTPDSIVLGEKIQPLVLALVARVQVVALRQRQRSRTREQRI